LDFVSTTNTVKGQEALAALAATTGNALLAVRDINLQSNQLFKLMVPVETTEKW
jgi:hypothetical protein